MTAASSELNQSEHRLVALDAFRGFTIAGMIIVNTPGSWRYIFDPLEHASWHGITPTDFIFPFFLFIVGVSITLAYHKRLNKGMLKKVLHQKILIRTLKIFAVGIFLWLFPAFDFTELRIVGVLQRIAVVFSICAFLFLHTNWKQQALLGSFLLIGYWLLMILVPVPADAVIEQAVLTGEVMRQAGPVVVSNIHFIANGYVMPNYEPGVNLAAFLDRLIIPGKMWEVTWDPEGLLSTLPSISTGICGMLTGKILIQKTTLSDKVLWIFVGGFLSFILGNIWSWDFPLNKNLWSSSFVLYTAGLAAMVLALCLFFIDVQGYKKWSRPGVIFGANAITVYTIAGILPTLFVSSGFGNLKASFFEKLVSLGVLPEVASLLYAVFFTLICFIPAYILYQRKIFIKL